jgi:hypothetical protein
MSPLGPSFVPLKAGLFFGDMDLDDARRVLARAAVQAGGLTVLAAELKLNERVLRYYIEGKEPIPDNLLLEVVDVILKQLPGPPSN